MLRAVAILGPMMASATALRLSAAARGPQSRTGSVKMLWSLLGGGDAKMVDPENALPGRKEKMMIPDRHYVLGNKLDNVPEGHKVAVFANGCFWGSEKGIWRLPGEGIYSTAVGYCAGFTPNPTYEEACS